ncbi:hypothetical protein HaLaN_23597 [Haematococcus lacustris]|uniref:Uncharacterized protein n=1 Tax=Haematococcus lacustris TaxID=44745 RepID=A0A6A0A076_HAELA|nr:hypothetical protein HaLaN_23597 [Haematococcus lacustris]
MRCIFSAALQSLSSHLPGCGAALLPAQPWCVCCALLRFAGRGVLGPGSEAVGCVAAWLLHGPVGACEGALQGMTSGPSGPAQAGHAAGSRLGAAGGVPPALFGASSL